MNKIKNNFFAFQSRLVNIGGEEPSNKLSLIVIIALDLFILFVLFQGLNDHTEQLTSPDEYIPYECKEIFINKGWSEANFLTQLQILVLSDHNNYLYRNDELSEKTKTADMHETCQDFYIKTVVIAKNQKLKKLFIDRQELLKQKEHQTSSFTNSKAVYDTSLLENIAGQKNNEKELPAIKTSINTHTTELERISQRLFDIEKQLNAELLIKDFRAMITPDNEYRQKIVEDFKKFQFSYPFKQLGWQSVFMLPIFFVFYIWNSRSIKKDNRIQIFISTHLLVVASIPIALKIGEVVLDLIPRHFLKNVFLFLQSMHIIAIWHYAVIFISIGVGLFIIYIIQKKIFNLHLIQQKRLMKGACYHCGKKLPCISTICPFCGTNQFKKCSKCEEETYVCGDYCKKCGVKLLPHF